MNGERENEIAAAVRRVLHSYLSSVPCANYPRDYMTMGDDGVPTIAEYEGPINFNEVGSQLAKAMDPIINEQALYGRKLPSRFQLGDAVFVEGVRCAILAVTFELVDFKDGLGLGPKILYRLGYPDGRVRIVYSQDVGEDKPKPDLKLVKTCEDCEGSGKAP